MINAPTIRATTLPTMAPAMMPIFLALKPELDPFEAPDGEPPSDEPREPGEPLRELLEEVFPVAFWIVVGALEYEMLGPLVVLEPYTYEVVPEGGESAHTTETDWMTI
jgi:hypothetical protein